VSLDAVADLYIRWGTGLPIYHLAGELVMVAVNYDWDELEDNIDEEYDDAASTIAEYTTEPDLYGNVISQRRSGQSSFLHCDGLGSTLAVTNSVGTVTDTYAYSAFGEVTEQMGSTVNPIRYIGQKGYYEDGVTLVYLVRHRPLIASKGRWLSADPSAFIDGMNHFQYAGNNPVGLVDPSGLMKCVVKPPGIHVDKDAREFFMEDYLDGFLGREFRVRVEFAGDCCICCEYRQLVKGFGPRARYLPGGNWQYANNEWGSMPPANQDAWREDCTRIVWVESPDIAVPIPHPDCYGHRALFNREGDSYLQPDDRDKGCVYTSKDAPGQPGINTIRKAAPKYRLEVEVVLYFRLVIYDFCTLDAEGKAQEVDKEEFGFVSKRTFPALV
jgi:RHS repeat-associated protein